MRLPLTWERTPMQALWKVIIPEIRPGMISGFMLALTLSIDDFAVTVFTIGNEGLETLSTYIYADARKGSLTRSFARFPLLFFVVVLALLIVMNLPARESEEEIIIQYAKYTDMLIAWRHVFVLVYLYIVKLLIMKRIIPAILLLLSLTVCYNSGEPRERVLEIYNWAGYIGDGVLEDFPGIL